MAKRKLIEPVIETVVVEKTTEQPVRKVTEKCHYCGDAAGRAVSSRDGRRMIPHCTAVPCASKAYLELGIAR